MKKKVKLEGEVKTTVLNEFNLRCKGLKKHSVSFYFRSQKRFFFYPSYIRILLNILLSIMVFMLCRIAEISNAVKH